MEVSGQYYFKYLPRGHTDVMCFLDMQTDFRERLGRTSSLCYKDYKFYIKGPKAISKRNVRAENMISRVRELFLYIMHSILKNREHRLVSTLQT